MTPDSQTKARNLKVIDFGITDYKTIYDEQKRWLHERLSNLDSQPDILLIGEHPHVITTGRGTKPENLLSPSFPIIEIERGGDVTYHGPGQLIAYPIHHLTKDKRDLHKYLRDLEKVIITTLKDFDIEGFRNEGLTGVWVLGKNGEKKKIASIGVAVKKWVTYHGIALNVDTDLSYFQQINPCGLESQVMTTVSQISNRSICLDDVKKSFINAYQHVFRTEDQNS